MRRDDLPFEQMRRMVECWRVITPFQLEGDYYPLTPWSVDPGHWIAWQFHDAAANEGVVQVFRRAESPYEAARWPLHALAPDTNYVVRDLWTGEERRASGEELMQDGNPCAIPDRPGVRNLHYAPEN